jgi:hypothetical protein
MHKTISTKIDMIRSTKYMMCLKYMVIQLTKYNLMASINHREHFLEYEQLSLTEIK